MPGYREQPDYQHGTRARIGILVTNLGTPDEPTPAALRRYLKQFLSDPRVVEIPRIAWWPILNGIILNVRPKKSAAKYQSIWTVEGSPLKVHTERQAKMLGGYLIARGHADVETAFGMRYGNPSVDAGLDSLVARGCDRIVVLPLYPQYAASTTASTHDAVADWARTMRNLPGLSFVRNFHDHSAYINALAASVREHWQREGGRADMLLMSFHGLPQYTLREGDPYHCECLKTGRLLAEALGLAPDTWKVTFQSRFGKAEWLQPYTADTLAQLGSAKLRRLDVICPGFPGDCLETLEEIAMEGKEIYQHAGGGKYAYIACLNERDDWLHALADIVMPHVIALARPSASTAELESARARAVKLGAAG
jgi:ferrochelatase